MLIINKDRNPKYSLYNIGAEVLNLLLKNAYFDMDILYKELNKRYNGSLSVDYFYITLDWLFLINKIKVHENKVYII